MTPLPKGSKPKSSDDLSFFPVSRKNLVNINTYTSDIPVNLFIIFYFLATFIN